MHLTKTEQATIAQNIKALRKRRGHSQESLSHAVDIAKATIQDAEREDGWRHGKSDRTLGKIAVELGTTIDQLRQTPDAARENARAFLKAEAERRGVTPEQVASDLIHGT